MIWLLFFILTWVAAAVFAYPFLFAQMLLLKQGQQSTVLAILGQMGGFVAKVLVGPLATIAFSLVYYDVRIRREAFDLQVMMAGLGPGATPGGSAPAA